MQVVDNRHFYAYNQKKFLVYRWWIREDSLRKSSGEFTPGSKITAFVVEKYEPSCYIGWILADRNMNCYQASVFCIRQ